MTNDKPAPREFWLADLNQYEPTVFCSSDTTISLKMRQGLSEDPSYIHVIEISALTALQKENEDLKRGISVFKCFNCGDYNHPLYQVNLRSEIKSLRDKLEIAREALRLQSVSLRKLEFGSMFTPEAEFKLANKNIEEALEKLQGEDK